MRKPWSIVIAILAAALLAGAVLLYGSDIPAPQERVERKLPVDRDGR